MCVYVYTILYNVTIISKIQKSFTNSHIKNFIIVQESFKPNTCIRNKKEFKLSVILKKRSMT